VGLERGPLSLVSTTEGIRRVGYATPLYLQELALTSPTGGDHLVGIVRSQTQAMELFFL
jgi:hypothetical protein